MASDIEKVANGVRGLAAHAGGTGREVGQAARATAALVDRAQAQGRSGLNVTRLVGQLQAAATRARAAAAAIEQVATLGDAFADHLAHSQTGRQPMAPGRAIGYGLIGVNALISFLSQSTPPSYMDSVVTGEPVDAKQVLTELPGHSLDKTGDLDDMNGYLRDADAPKAGTASTGPRKRGSAG